MIAKFLPELFILSHEFVCRQPLVGLRPPTAMFVLSLARSLVKGMSPSDGRRQLGGRLNVSHPFVSPLNGNFDGYKRRPFAIVGRAAVSSFVPGFLRRKCPSSQRADHFINGFVFNGRHPPRRPGTLSSVTRAVRIRLPSHYGSCGRCRRLPRIDKRFFNRSILTCHD